MYIHMLGYPTHFGQLECLKLVSAPSFPDKRVGYLALTVLLTEQAEVLTLVTNSLKVDLSSTNQYIQALSLVAIGNLATQDMARDLSTDVERILRGSNSYLRKKAALACIRLIKKEPDLIEHLIERIVALLKDRTHGVLIAGMDLVVEVIRQEPDFRSSFSGLVPGLVRLLRNFSSMGFSPEHDVNGVTDPFMQVKVIEVLGVLGKDDEEASDQMNDVLAQVASTTETNKNAGNAILYECVKAIMTIKSDSALKTLAINILGRFLINRDNNIRYVALNSLSKVVTEDMNAVQRHRETIIECLKDVDISIRQRALELAFQLVNPETVGTITTEILNYLVVSNSEHKPELVEKIMQIVERFSQTSKWRLDTLVTMLSVAGNFCEEATTRLAIIFIAQAEGLHGYAVHRLFGAMKEDMSQYSLNLVASWCVGEFGELLFQACPPTEDFPGCPGISPSEAVSVLSSLLSHHTADLNSKSTTLNSLMKLSVRANGDSSVLASIRSAIEPLSNSLSVELQQRATEYLLLLQTQWDALRPELLARMPVLDENTLRSKRRFMTMSNDMSAPTNSGADGGADLMNLLGAPMNSSSTAPNGGASGASKGSSLLDLDDIFGSPPPAAVPGGAGAGAAAMPPAAPAGGADMLSDMFGSTSISGATSAPVTNVLPAGDLLGALGSPSSPAPALASGFSGLSPTVTPTAAANTVKAYEKNGLKVDIELIKPEPANPSKTKLLCKFSNTTSAKMSNLSFQAAVPKYLKLEMHPPSSSDVPAGSDSSTTQSISLVNSMQGEKNIMLKVKVSFTMNGSKVEDQATVNSFPPLY